jgi:hypothetical protein
MSNHTIKLHFSFTLYHHPFWNFHNKNYEDGRFCKTGTDMRKSYLKNLQMLLSSVNLIFAHTCFNKAFDDIKDNL